MLLPIRLICPPQLVKKNGCSTIFIQYCQNSSNKTILNTGVQIPPEYWNKNQQKILDSLPLYIGRVGELNKELYRQLRLAEDIITFGLECKVSDPVMFVRQAYKPDFDILTLRVSNRKGLNVKENLDVFYQFDKYIESKKRQVAPATINVYNETKRYLQAYEDYAAQKLTFESFDLNFYDDFLNFLTYDYCSYRYKKTTTKGLKINTIGKAVKHIRIFITDRIRRKIIPTMDLSMFKSMEEQSDAIYLTKDEIEKIAASDMSCDKILEQVRDLFVLGCYTGLRFSDFSCIRSEDVRDKTLYKKQQKSNHWVVIPLREQADYILKQKFHSVIPNLSNSIFNSKLKLMGKMSGLTDSIKFSYKQGNKMIPVVKPKYEWITSHTCRRSFCTNEFLAGTPVELIMKISGHKSLKDFYKYIKITPEEAAERIKDIWLKRGEMN